MSKEKHVAGQIKVSDGTITFVDVVIKDAVIAAEFTSAIEAGVDPVEFAYSLLDIGARTASLRSNTAGAEKIEASINQAKTSISETAKTLEEAVKKQVKDLAADDGVLIKGIQSIIDTYQEEVEELASGEDSELRKAMLKLLKDAKEEISKDVKNTVDAQRKAIGELLDPANATSPLRSLAEKMQGVVDSIEDIKRESATEVAVAEALETGITGGLDYESVAVNATQQVASLAGDDCEHTGGFTGRVPRSKMGDGVVDLKVGGKVYGRIVVEAKNSKLTKKDWEAEAKGSKENRGASGFIGFCKHPNDMPNNSKILILDPQTIVIQFNPEFEDLTFLALVYQIVKMNTLNNAGKLDGLDIAEVNISLQEAIRALGEFDELKKTASSIENGAKKVKKQADSIRDGVQDRINKVQQAIAKEFESQALESGTDPLEIEE
ncbi:hypothetical protein [Aquiluna sp. Uisw_065]|uniref:hypothetical protein n=1 Tax=Aquiluna sp. Uisw_065 TaxID=3230967 RepID=UPI0039E832A2